MDSIWYRLPSFGTDSPWWESTEFHFSPGHHHEFNLLRLVIRMLIDQVSSPGDAMVRCF